MTAMIIKLLTDVGRAMLFKVAWKIVLERFLTRLVCWGLDWLAKLTTNTVDDALVADIKAGLRGRKLPEATDDPSKDKPR